MSWGKEFLRQCAFEAEGAAAGLAGKTRADCPYDKENNLEAWNFWVYGCENAAGEKAVMERGIVEFYVPLTGERLSAMPVRAAINSGDWQPRWAKLPAPASPAEDLQ